MYRRSRRVYILLLFHCIHVNVVFRGIHVPRLSSPSSANMINVSYIADVLYGGVDFTLQGNGGRECVDYLTLNQRIVETVVYELFTIFVFWKTLGKVSIPRDLLAYREGTGVGKRFLLVLLCLIFGIEIGFKFATKQVIFLLNPCHVITAMQVD